MNPNLGPPLLQLHWQFTDGHTEMRSQTEASNNIEKVGIMEKEMKGLFFIGDFRRFFFVNGTHWWNGFLRDVTAKWEGSWLIRSSK